MERVVAIVHYQLSIEMKNNERDDRFEKRLRFVVRHYKEGSLDEDKAWKRFAGQEWRFLVRYAGRTGASLRKRPEMG